MRNNYFRRRFDAMKNNENYKLTYKLTAIDRQAVINDIDNLIRQLKITKEGMSVLYTNYRAKRHVAEWLFADSKQLDDIIKKLTDGGYDND